MTVKLRYCDDNHPIYQVPNALLTRIRNAQDAVLEHAYSSSKEFCQHACALAMQPASLADTVAGMKLDRLAALSHSELTAHFGASNTDLSPQAIGELCDHIQLLGAFADPNDAIERLRSRVELVVKGFPRTAAEIERGKNPGDVLDPFLLTATSELLFAGNVPDAMEATVAHKAMMMIEDLAGHLHEEVIGEMRGNLRVPEPSGVDKEQLDFEKNPFPGADVAQPPRELGTRFRFFQVKSKTGTAKGGDAPRIAGQLTRLKGTYRADVFFCSVVGDTLKGHRSMGGMVKADPDIVIQTGETALATLTGRSNGGELLLRLYQRAFRRAAKADGYEIPKVAASVVKELLGKARYAEGLEEVVLDDATQGAPQQQDSRTYRSLRRKRR